MDLNTPASVTKKTRAKATPAVEPSKKPTLTTKAKRAPKKVAPVVESTTLSDPVTDLAIESSVNYTSDQLRSLIATAAYYRAADRGFAPGNEVDDWLVAEQQVIASLS